MQTIRSTAIISIGLPLIAVIIAVLAGGGGLAAVETQVASGEDFSLLLDADGAVWAWGANGRGQLGNGTTTAAPPSAPVAVTLGGSPFRQAIAIAAGGDSNGNSFALALRADGTVWAWGDNSFGECGDGTSGVNRTNPVQVKIAGGTPLGNIIAISAGTEHALAVRADGTVWAWGQNSSGQFGNGTVISQSFAVQMPGISSAISVAAGHDQSLILLANGTVFACGGNARGQLGDLSTTQRTTPVQVIISRTTSVFPFRVTTTYLRNVTAISAGLEAGMALTAAGEVYTWGDDTWGQLGLGSTTATPSLQATQVTTLDKIRSISCGLWGSKWALDVGGNLYGWGYAIDGRLGFADVTNRNVPQRISQPPGQDVRQMSEGRQVGAFITGSGAVYRCGTGTGTPSLVSAPWNMLGIMQVAQGGSHTLYLKADGTVWATGNNDSGQLGDGTTATAYRPVQVLFDGGSPLTNAIAVAAGTDHSLALRADGLVLAWGNNSNGQLGGGGTAGFSSVPVKVAGNIRTVATGYLSSFVIYGDGRLFCAGFNSYGQLGQGTDSDVFDFAQAIGAGGDKLVSVKAVAGSYYSSLALLGDGSVRGSGNNEYAQLGTAAPSRTAYYDVTPGGSLSVVKGIGAGGFHAAFLVPNGTVLSTGINFRGVIGNGTSGSVFPVTTPTAANLSGRLAKAISVIPEVSQTTWALLATGSAIGWGDNRSGQLSNGSLAIASLPTDVRAATTPPTVQEGICQLSGTESVLATLLVDGSTKGAGVNSYGQLGNDSKDDTQYLVPPIASWLPQIIASTVDSAAAESGSDPGFVSLTRSLSTVGSLTVSLVYGGTATSGSDYPAPATTPPTATFPPGSSSITVPITPLDDSVDEDDETVQVTVAASTSYGEVSGSALITIADNDTAGILTSPSAISTSENAGTATIGMRLATQPTANVTLDISSLNVQEARVSTGTLLFTPANWSSPQTITVTGQPDSVDDGNQAYTIKVSVSTSTDAKYAPLLPVLIPGTSIDVDTSGFTIGNPSGPTTENGGTATFTVSLTSKPTANVTLPIATSNVNEATASPPALNFNAANWNVPQTVTLTGVPDLMQDGNQSYSIQFGPAVSNDAGYNAIVPPAKTNTNTDVDVARIITSLTALSLTEGAAATTMNVRLGTKPVGQVTVTLANANNQIRLGTTAAAVTLSALNLTFSAANWNVDQRIFIAATDDPDIESPHPNAAVVIATSASVDTVYRGLAATALIATMTDNDVFTIVTSKANLSTDENGTSDTVTITFTAKPTQPVTVTLTIPVISGIARREGDFVASPTVAQNLPVTTTVQVLPAEWNTGKVVTVYGIHESPIAVDNNQTYPVTVTTSSTDGNFVRSTAISLFTVTNSDVDVAGIRIQQRTPGDTANDSETVLTEGGATDVYQLQLTKPPTGTGTVVIVNVLPPPGIIASPAYLLFNAANYNTFQSITLTAQDDQTAQGSRNLRVQHSTALCADPLYNQLASSVLSGIDVAVTDNDRADVLVSPSGGLTTAETGTQANFGVVLTSQPSTTVQIPLTVSDPAEVEISVDDGITFASGASLSFSPTTWFRAQTVFIRGRHDQVADGDKPFTVILGAATAVGDVNYAGFDPIDVNGVNTDIDATGFIITPTTGLSTTEAGGTATFTVALRSKPTANVTIGVASADTPEVSAAPGSITFTPTDWSARTVTVTGHDDLVADGDRAVAILLIPDAATTDDGYRNLTPPVVNLVNRDDDNAGLTVTPTLVGGNPALITRESGTTAQFTVVLGSQPTSDVTIPLSASPADEVSLSASALTFTTADWSTPQTVTVTGIDDGIADGDQTVTIVTGLAISSDATYNGRDPANVTDVNQDDDTAGVTVALVSVPSGGRLQTSEAGAFARFSVVLTCQPAATVTIPLSSTDTAQGTPSSSSLEFTPDNWDEPQTVTVTGKADGALEADVDYALALAGCSSSDTAYNANFAQNVLLTNLALNNRPTLTAIGDQTLLEDSPATTITLLGLGVGQLRETAQTTTVTAVSDTPSLIPNPTVNAAAGTITLQPVANGVGSARITVTVTDTGSTARTGDVNTLSRTFTVNVTAVNDAPSFTKGGDQTVDEDAGARTIPGWATAISAGPADEATQVLTFTATAADPALFQAQPQIDAATGNLTFTPAANAFGTTTITVSLQDDGGTINGGVTTSAVQTATITIRSLNDPPSFLRGADVIVNEDASAQIVTAWATAISPGPANEAAQVPSFVLTVDHPELFTVVPTLDATGTLTFTPAPEAAGIATVTVVLHDDGGIVGGGADTSAPITLTITITAVNDAPVATVSPAAGRPVLIGGSRAITAADLFATDVDSASPAPVHDPALIFTLQLVPGAGTLARSGVALAAGDTFTQQDLIDGRLLYTHGGGTGQTDGFAFTVSDLGIAAGGIVASPPFPPVALAPASSTPQVFAIAIDRRPPLVVLAGAVPTFSENQPLPILVADGATVVDGDSATFNAGAIRVSVGGGFAPQAILSLLDQGTGVGQVSIAGSTVRVTPTPGNTIDVGTLSGGSGTDLVIACNANMDPPAAQLVLRSLQFITASEDPPTAVPITVVITDDHGDTSAPQTRIVSITPIDDPPQATVALVVTAANQPVDGRVVVADPDDTVFTFTIVSAPAKGSVSAFAADGSFTYTPALDLAGNDQFTVRIDDGSGGTVDQVVLVRISGAGATARPWIISDPPVEVQTGAVLLSAVRVATRGLAAGFDVQFALIDAPAGMVINKSAPDTADLNWTAVHPAGGDHVAFRIRATETVSGLVCDQPVVLYVHPITSGAE